MTDSYWWFQGKSVERLLAALEKAGPGARLECRPLPSGGLHLVVKDATGHGADPINDSHACPPDCGGG